MWHALHLPAYLICAMLVNPGPSQWPKSGLIGKVPGRAGSGSGPAARSSGGIF
jgi:hypothetical protein